MGNLIASEWNDVSTGSGSDRSKPTRTVEVAGSNPVATALGTDFMTDENKLRHSPEAPELFFDILLLYFGVIELREGENK
jgi:hypothetical protein